MGLLGTLSERWAWQRLLVPETTAGSLCSQVGSGFQSPLRAFPAVPVTPSREWPQLQQDARAVTPRCFSSGASRHPTSQAGPHRHVSPLQGPETACSTLVPCGSMLRGLPRLKTTLVDVPGWPAWLGQGQAILAFSLLWTTAPFMSAPRKPSRIIPPPSPQFSFLPPPSAVRGFPALPVTPGQLEGHQARGARPRPEAGLGASSARHCGLEAVGPKA